MLLVMTLGMIEKVMVRAMFGVRVIGKEQRIYSRSIGTLS